MLRRLMRTSFLDQHVVPTAPVLAFGLHVPWGMMNEKAISEEYDTERSRNLLREAANAVKMYQCRATRSRVRRPQGVRFQQAADGAPV